MFISLLCDLFYCVESLKMLYSLSKGLIAKIGLFFFCRYQPFRYEDNTTRVAVKRLKAGTDNEYTKKMFNAEVNALKR